MAVGFLLKTLEASSRHLGLQCGGTLNRNWHFHSANLQHKEFDRERTHNLRFRDKKQSDFCVNRFIPASNNDCCKIKCLLAPKYKWATYFWFFIILLKHRPYFYCVLYSNSKCKQSQHPLIPQWSHRRAKISLLPKKSSNMSTSELLLYSYSA